jgi:hypothetical protein
MNTGDVGSSRGSKIHPTCRYLSSTPNIREHKESKPIVGTRARMKVSTARRKGGGASVFILSVTRLQTPTAGNKEVGWDQLSVIGLHSSTLRQNHNLRHPVGINHYVVPMLLASCVMSK